MGLQPPLPSSRTIKGVSERGGSGNCRWGDGEGWGEEWWLGRCASEVRLPVEKARDQQGMPSQGKGAEPGPPERPQSPIHAAQGAERRQGPCGILPPQHVLASSLGLSQRAVPDVRRMRGNCGA